MVALSGFVKQVLGVLVAALVLGGYPLYAFTEPETIWGVVVGCGICTLNVVAGCLSMVWAFEKPHTVFLKTLFGGMAVRLMGMGLVLFLLIRLTTLHVLGLILSLFVFYTVFQVLEIRFLVGHLPGREVPKEGISDDG